MTPDDRRAVEEAARRIVEYDRWRKKNGQGGRGFPLPPLEVLEAHVGGFTYRTVKLARRALARAREIRGKGPRRGRRRRAVDPPEGLPQYVGQNDGELYTAV